MNFIESIGYLASALVLATFCMRNMVALRCAAWLLPATWPSSAMACWPT